MIRVFDDPESVSRTAADIFMEKAREAVHDRGRFTVALAGGNTPRRTYELLAMPPRAGQIPWSDIHVFWGDERCVEAGDERNNARMARQTLLAKVAVPSSHIHPILCAGDPGAEAARYDHLLRTYFVETVPVLDLVFLGLGQDGHTASLFPYSSVLEEEDRLAAEVLVAEPQVSRVTLTSVIINAARIVVFLVFGRGKAQILKSVLEGPIDASRLPAQRIKPTGGRLVWLLDREAASLLEDATL